MDGCYAAETGTWYVKNGLEIGSQEWFEQGYDKKELVEMGDQPTITVEGPVRKTAMEALARLRGMHGVITAETGKENDLGKLERWQEAVRGAVLEEEARRHMKKRNWCVHEEAGDHNVRRAVLAEQVRAELAEQARHTSRGSS